MPVLNSASLAAASIQKQLRIFRRILLIILLIVAVLGAIVGLCSMEDQVSGDGFVTGHREYILRSPVDGKVAGVNFSAGELCRKGSVLVKMDDRELQIDIASIKKRLAAAGNTAAPEYLDLHSKLQKLELIAGSTAITAPEDGIALEVAAWPGGYFRRGDALLKLIAVNPRQVITYIHEKQIPKVRAGAEVRISSKLYNYLDHGYFYGEVSSIGDTPEIRSGEVYFPVRITLKGGAEKLRIGSSCRATVVVGRQRMLYNFFGFKNKK